MSQCDSAIAFGQTYHRRFLPTQHQFSYPLYYAWVDLNDVSGFQLKLQQFGRLPWLRLNSKDYLGEDNAPLKEKALALLEAQYPTYQASQLILICQLRCMGLYFSPVNFVLFGNQSGFDYLLAEVTNTPWGEKHHYWLDLNQLEPHPKGFHVSPFNPMEMTYHWQVELKTQIRIQIDCWREQKTFTAGVTLDKHPVNRTTLSHVLRKHPLLTFRVVTGIYIQAFKLWLKKTPIYRHPNR